MDDRVAQLLEKQAIVETINRLFIAIDRRNWPGVHTCFADQVFFDTTSSSGREPATLSPGEIAEGWEEALAGVDAVHHQSGNYLVDVRGAEGSAFCYTTASHHRRGEPTAHIRLLVGSYSFRLKKDTGRWRIDSVRYDQKYAAGHAPSDSESAPA